VPKVIRQKLLTARQAWRFAKPKVIRQKLLTARQAWRFAKPKVIRQKLLTARQAWRFAKPKVIRQKLLTARQAWGPWSPTLVAPFVPPGFGRQGCTIRTIFSVSSIGHCLGNNYLWFPCSGLGCFCAAPGLLLSYSWLLSAGTYEGPEPGTWSTCHKRQLHSTWIDMCCNLFVF
jgi:hypothetical protein